MKNRNLLRYALPIVLMAIAGVAMAQNVSVDSIQGAAKGDPSVTNMLVKIFGDIAANPFGGSSGGLGAGFAMLNACALAIGVSWFTYTVAAGVVQTAHDGEFLGKRYSSVWLPIRFTVGIGALVPIFAGYSLAQAFMLWAATSGVGIANLVNEAVLSELEKGKPVMTTQRTSAREAAYGLFTSYVCMHAANLSLSEARKSVEPPPPGDLVSAFVTSATEKKVGLSKFGGSGQECGSISFAPGAGNSATAASGNGVAAAQIQKIVSVQNTAFSMLDSGISELAEQWTKDFVNEEIHGEAGVTVDVPLRSIESLARRFEVAVQKAAMGAEAVVDKAAKQSVQEIKQKGWSYLGTYYQSIAIVSEQVAAASAFNVAWVAPKEDVANPEIGLLPATRYVGPALGKVDRRLSSTLAHDANTVTSASGATAGGQQVSCDGVREWASNPGMCLARGMLGWMVGVNRLANSEEVNPVFVAKGIGDGMTIAGGTVVTIAGVSWASSRVGSAVANFNLDGAFGTFAVLIATSMIAFGLLLSVYIPMLPYVIWFGALMAWVAVVAEAVIAAPLWAMMHLDGEGDGMGNRTGHGYLFLVNVLFRPVLMVLGFFIAGSVVLVMGKYLNSTFLTAAFNMHLDGGENSSASISFLFGAMGLIFVYVSLMLTLIHGAFNLIHVVPDQVLGWLGGSLGTQVGRDSDDRAKGVFIGGAGQMTSQAKAAAGTFNGGGDSARSQKDPKLSVGGHAGDGGAKKGNR